MCSGVVGLSSENNTIWPCVPKINVPFSIIDGTRQQQDKPEEIQHQYALSIFSQPAASFFASAQCALFQEEQIRRDNEKQWHCQTQHWAKKHSCHSWMDCYYEYCKEQLENVIFVAIHSHVFIASYFYRRRHLMQFIPIRSFGVMSISF